QIIAGPAGFVSIGQHAPLTGTVKAIEMRHHPNGQMVESVIIKKDPFSPQTFYNEHSIHIFAVSRCYRPGYRGSDMGITPPGETME
ncbi:MAG: hypothetical protein GY940_30695, partial [bacterium]|nr:hypothetical protein [bacterium]